MLHGSTTVQDSTIKVVSGRWSCSRKEIIAMRGKGKHQVTREMTVVRRSQRIEGDDSGGVLFHPNMAGEAAFLFPCSEIEKVRRACIIAP